MEPSGYPSFLLYVILFIGIPLAFVRPFKAFLMVVFLVSAADTLSYTFTRTELLGPYFNANDACLLIALLAVVSYRLFKRKKIQFPIVIKWILIVLFIGFVQSYVLGLVYEALRSLRWAISLPFYFIIAASMVDEKEKIKPFLITLLLGSVVSAIAHILFVKSRIPFFMLYGDIGQFRTISFRSPGLWLLLAGLIWLPNIQTMKRPVLLVVGMLFAVSVLLNQTRSIWIASIAVLPVTFIFFKQKKIMVKAIALPVFLTILYAGVFLIVRYTIPGINPNNIIMERISTVTYEDLRWNTTISRKLSFEREIEEWSKGTYVLGRGLSYFAPYYKDYYGEYRVAWGHLGHVTTLAQLGLVGLFVYSFYLPINVVQSSRLLWLKTSNEVKFLGLLAGLTMIWFWICFIVSDSFLSQNAARGIIFGVAWRQATLLTDYKVFKITNFLSQYRKKIRW